jgi:hypothetical protein
MKKLYDIEQLHYYASLFSGNVVQRSLKYNDYSAIFECLHRYDSDLMSRGLTYWDYFDYVYRILEKNYRNEYVYKNTLIKGYIVKEYSLKETKVFNEFRIGSSIADLAMFNGTSKAFEIKTELDNDKRLASQLGEYAKLMEEAYLVVSADLVDKYLPDIDPGVGIIALYPQGRSLKIESRRDARKNSCVDIDVLMSSVRCDEYRWMVKTAYGSLPDVSDFEMFDACKDLLKRLPSTKLQRLFLDAVKKRKNSTGLLKSVPRSANLLCLSMDWNESYFAKLNELYGQPIRM